MVEKNELRDEFKGKLSAQSYNECVESRVGEWVVDGEQHAAAQEVEHELIDVGWPRDVYHVEASAYEEEQQQEVRPESLELPEAS